MSKLKGLRWPQRSLRKSPKIWPVPQRVGVSEEFSLIEIGQQTHLPSGEVIHTMIVFVMVSGAVSVSVPPAALRVARAGRGQPS